MLAALTPQKQPCQHLSVLSQHVSALCIEFAFSTVHTQLSLKIAGAGERENSLITCDPTVVSFPLL